jgi:hypothetical protein
MAQKNAINIRVGNNDPVPDMQNHSGAGIPRLSKN